MTEENGQKPSFVAPQGTPHPSHHSHKYPSAGPALCWPVRSPLGPRALLSLSLWAGLPCAPFPREGTWDLPHTMGMSCAWGDPTAPSGALVGTEPGAPPVLGQPPKCPSSHTWDVLPSPGVVPGCPGHLSHFWPPPEQLKRSLREANEGGLREGCSTISELCT